MIRTLAPFALLFLLVGPSTEPLFAQSVGWARSFGGQRKTGMTNNHVELRSITTDSSDHIYVSGIHTGHFPLDELGELFPPPGHVAGFLAKLGADGAPLWARSFRSAYDCRINAHATGTDGRTVITGFFDGTVTLPGARDTLKLTVETQGILIASYDAVGNVVWGRKFATSEGQGVAAAMNGSGETFVVLYYQKTLTGDGGVALDRANWNSGQKDVVLLKYDPQGNIVWLRELGVVDRPTTFRLRCDRSDNIFLTGSFSGSLRLADSIVLRNDRNLEVEDGFVARLDDSGKGVWARQLGGRNSQEITDFQLDRDGSVIATGEYDFECVVRDGETILDSSGYHYKSGSSLFVLKLDSEGKRLWTRFVADSGYNTYFYSRALSPPDARGEVHIFGTYTDTVEIDSHIAIPTVLKAPSRQGYYAWYGRWDRDGKLQGIMSLHDTVGGNLFMFGAALTSSGRVAAAGFFQEQAFLGYDTTGRKVKLENFSGLNTGLVATWRTGNAVSGVEGGVVNSRPGIARPLSIDIFPNPASGSVNITIFALAGDASVEIYDQSGRLVRSRFIDEAEASRGTDFVLRDLPAGAYTLRVRAAEVDEIRSFVVVK